MAKKTKTKRNNRFAKFGIIVVIVLIIINIGMVGLYRVINPLILKSETYEVQLNGEFDPLDNIRYVFLGDEQDVKVSGLCQTNVAGTYPMTYTYKGKDYRFNVEVNDYTAPALVVKDYVTDTNEDVIADNFVESCADDSEFSYKCEIVNDAKEAGTYTVNVTATDKYGNAITQQARLIREQDEEAPTIENFEEEVEIPLGTGYSTDIYKAVDNLDKNPNIHVDTSTIDSSTPGSYTVTFDLSDRSGNQNTLTQTVNVVDKKICYLTFDDGPSAENTQKILDTLDKYNVKATFFVTGANPEAYDMMKKEAEAGHTVALHTMTHDYSIYASPETYFADLQQIRDLVKQETGIESNLIRFPGGSSNTVSMDYNYGIMSYLTQEVLNQGYQYFDWNVSSGDAAGDGVPAETIVQNVNASIGEPVAVVLMHDTDAKSTTVEALPAIIEAYQAAGYEFLPLDKDSYPAHHGVNN